MIRLYGGVSSARLIRVQHRLQQPRQALVTRAAARPRTATPWRARQQPRLERKPRRIRRQRHDVGVLVDDAAAVAHLLPDDVAEDAALLRREVPPARPRSPRARSRARSAARSAASAVLERRAGRRAVVLEHAGCSGSRMSCLQIEHALAERPQHPLDLRLGHRRQRLVVIRASR